MNKKAIIISTFTGILMTAFSVQAAPDGGKRPGGDRRGGPGGPGGERPSKEEILKKFDKDDAQ